MVVQLRPRAITVERGSRGFGLSLIYRGLDKYEEKDTGIFVARVVPGGQAARYGVREDDKILTINGKTPRNVDDAVGVIKQAGNQIKLVVLRAEDVPGNPDIIVDPSDAERTSLASAEMDSKWVSSLFCAKSIITFYDLLACTVLARSALFAQCGNLCIFLTITYLVHWQFYVKSISVV